MENASKALIIAGAILLSILIIGLGMTIYRQAAGVISNTGLDEQKAQTYNSVFLQYEGVQSGANVKQLLSTVIQHNNAAADYSELINAQKKAATSVTDNGANAASFKNKADYNAAITKLRNGVLEGKQYTVTFGYDKNTGYIVCVGFALKK
ncbi:MAG: hypothetical protein IJ777_02215 [Clostridia bacterium]|nr:hypothetical protein [Clostridia bacterium]